jgi:hypothetical protein
MPGPLAPRPRGSSGIVDVMPVLFIRTKQGRF